MFETTTQINLGYNSYILLTKPSFGVTSADRSLQICYSDPRHNLRRAFLQDEGPLRSVVIKWSFILPPINGLINKWGTNGVLYLEPVFGPTFARKLAALDLIPAIPASISRAERFTPPRCMVWMTAAKLKVYGNTLPKTNSKSPCKYGPSQKERPVFQASILRCKLAVSFRGCMVIFHFASRNPPTFS